MNIALPLLMRKASTNGPLAATYRGQQTETASTATPTFSNLDVGTADAARVVVLAIELLGVAGGPAPTSVTIGGVTASQITGTYMRPTNGGSVWLYSAVVPTGTLATVSITCASAPSGTAIGWWTVLGGVASSTGSSTTSGDAGATAVSLTVTGVLNGVIICVAGCPFNTGYNAWTNATERFDNIIDSAYRLTLADATTVGSTTITATQSANNVGRALAIAVLAPF